MTLVRHIDALDAVDSLDALERVYLDAYADPPYSYGAQQLDAFRGHFHQQTQVEGFALVAAFEDDQIAGFTHGVPFGAGRWFRFATTPAPDGIVEQTKFAIIQFVVSRGYQGKGIGRLLMQTILADRPEEYCILTCYPDVKARAIYERWGWRRVGASHPPHLAEMDALALPLKQARTTSPLFR